MELMHQLRDTAASRYIHALFKICEERQRNCNLVPPTMCLKDIFSILMELFRIMYLEIKPGKSMPVDYLVSATNEWSLLFFRIIQCLVSRISQEISEAKAKVSSIFHIRIIHCLVSRIFTGNSKAKAEVSFILSHIRIIQCLVSRISRETSVAKAEVSFIFHIRIIQCLVSRISWEISVAKTEVSHIYLHILAGKFAW